MMNQVNDYATGLSLTKRQIIAVKISTYISPDFLLACKSMNMRLLVWILLFHITASQAQQSFDGIWSSGNIPQDFIKTSGQKFQADIATIDQNLKDQNNAPGSHSTCNPTTFLTSCSRWLHHFGDPVTKYLEGVLDKVLAADPKLRKELRIYTFKSTIPNAFTNGSGIILVTTGLLAQLENEAELAFILAHEAVHYREQHAINNYVENTRLLQGRGLYRNLSAEEVELTQFQYSRDLETESDLEGLEYYLKTDYQPDAAIAAMDVLLYSYLPFEENRMTCIPGSMTTMVLWKIYHS